MNRVTADHQYPKKNSKQNAFPTIVTSRYDLNNMDLIANNSGGGKYKIMYIQIMLLT